MKNYIKYGNSFYTSDGKQLTLVQDPETNKALKAGQIPYKSESVDRPLTFGDSQSMNSPQTSPYYQQSNTQSLNTGGTEASASTSLGGGNDFESLLKSKFMEAMKGLTNSKVPGLEAKQRELLTQKLMAPASDYSQMAPQDIIRSANARGSEFDPGIEQVTRDISQEKAYSFDTLKGLASLADIAKTFSPAMQKKTDDIIEWEYRNNLTPSERTEWDAMRAKQEKTKTDALSLNQSANLEMRLSNDFERHVQDSRVALRNKSNIDSAFAQIQNEIAKGGSLNAPSTVMIFAFNKVLDAISVVREGEYARTAEGQSLINRVDGFIQKIIQGGAGVGIQDLMSIKTTTDGLMDNYRNSIYQQARKTENFSKKYGLSMDTILTPQDLELLQGGINVKNQQLPSEKTIRVKLKTTGQTGTLPEKEFDPNLYEKI